MNKYAPENEFSIKKKNDTETHCGRVQYDNGINEMKTVQLCLSITKAIKAVYVSTTI